MEQNTIKTQTADRATTIMHLMEVAAIIFSVDQLTKFLVMRYIPLYESWAPIPGFGRLLLITHTINTGAAFGSFQQFQKSSNLFMIIAFLVAAAIIYYVATTPAIPMTLRVSMGLMLGGAMGNGWDRVRHGAVTDFVDIGFWAIFNVADVAVISGVLLLAYWMWQEDIKEKQSKSSELPTA